MVKRGDRIELVSINDEHTTLTPGDTGQVEEIDIIPPDITEREHPQKQIWVYWDNGHLLALLEGIDEYKVISSNKEGNT